MVSLKIQNFGAMIPAVDSQLLPQSSADYSENVEVFTGAVEGFHQFSRVHTLANPATQKVFRIPIDLPDAARMSNSYWLEFDTANVDVIQAPTDGDQFDRYYWASTTGTPSYNTKARIAAGDPALTLGIPAPATAPVVTPTGGSAPAQSRAYVYTWVTEFGEESPPSPPTLVTGNADATWAVSMSAPGAVATGRLLDRVRVYRTVSGVGGETDYFFVAEQSIADTTYDDTVAVVTGNPILESLFWTSPPSDLAGFVSMPNGIIASWRENEVWFCEPYRPHAWPVTYQVTVDTNVVGCGAFGQTLIVCTTTATFAITGVNPGTMSITRLAGFEPCLSRGSIVPAPMGVMYASPNGVVLASATGLRVVSSQLLKKDDWQDLLAVPSLYGASLSDGYYCFGSTLIGCFDDGAFNTDAFLQQDFTGAFTGAYVDLADARVGYTVLKSSVPVRSIGNDVWTGEVLLVRDDGVYWLRQESERPRQPYKWKSKVFETPNMRNFEAMRVYFTTDSHAPELDPVRNTSQSQTLAADQYGLVRVYADGALRFTRELRESGEFFRLPSGFKATFWQVELEARVRVNSIEITTSARELRGV